MRHRQRPHMCGRQGSCMHDPSTGGCTGRIRTRMRSQPERSGAAMHARAVHRFVPRPLRILSVVLAAGLVLAATAMAAKPKHNARFAGFTSAPPIVGFKAPVTFKVAANGLSLSNFSFGTFGCFGAGGFRPGINPYTHSMVNAGKLKVSAAGKVSASVVSSVSSPAGTSTIYKTTVTVRFMTPTPPSGPIPLIEENSSGRFHASSEREKKTLAATAHCGGVWPDIPPGYTGRGARRGHIPRQDRLARDAQGRRHHGRRH